MGLFGRHLRLLFVVTALVVAAFSTGIDFLFFLVYLCVAIGIGSWLYARRGLKSVRADYRLLPFTDDFGAALSAADLVVARAGGSVWEVAAAGRPALLVPYPHATADHQTENARYFERGGGAVVVLEPDLDLRRQVDELLCDPQRLGEMGESMKALARPNAADDIAKELLRLAS